MSDIFISYASSDRKRAKTLAEALEKKGWSVWWDRKITPGKSFDQVIEKALKETKCVVVLWSKESVNSNWVKDEAREGLKRNILVPALIEDVEMPLGFRGIQAANLVNWSGTSEHTEFDEMVAAIAAIAGEPKRVATEEVYEPKEKVKPTREHGLLPTESLSQPYKTAQEGYVTIPSDTTKTPKHVRIIGALIGALLGLVYVAVFILGFTTLEENREKFVLFSLFLGGIPGAIAGAIMGTNFRILWWLPFGILITSIILWFTSKGDPDRITVIGSISWFFGAPGGAILGLIIETLRKSKQPT